MNMHGADADGQATRRRFLPMLGHTTGKRSAVTCALKCDNACFHPVPNTSRNEYFRDVAGLAFSRRGFLAGAVASSAVVIGYATVGDAPAALAAPGGGKLDFAPIAPVPAVFDQFVVPVGYQWSPIIRWGDPLFSAGGRVRSRPPDRRPPGAAVRLQQRLPRHHRRPLRPLCGPGGQPGVHEREHHVPACGNSRRARRAASHRDGGPRDGGRGTVAGPRRRVHGRYIVGAPLNRRITASTPFTFSGPAAGSDMLKTQDDPTGTRRPRHAGQLRRRHDPVGHRAVGRRELQRLLPHGGNQRGRQALRPLRPGDRRAVGSRSIRASTPAIRGTRTSRTGSDGSSKSTPCTPRRRRSSTRRSGASSTRARTSSSESPGTSPRTWAMTSGSTTSTSSSRRAPSRTVRARRRGRATSNC